jgi:hypothetical protein
MRVIVGADSISARKFDEGYRRGRFHICPQSLMGVIVGADSISARKV